MNNKNCSNKYEDLWNWKKYQLYLITNKGMRICFKKKKRTKHLKLINFIILALHRANWWIQNRDHLLQKCIKHLIFKPKTTLQFYPSVKSTIAPTHISNSHKSEIDFSVSDIKSHLVWPAQVLSTANIFILVWMEIEVVTNWGKLSQTKKMYFNNCCADE